MNKSRKLLILLLAVTSVFVGCNRNSTNTQAIISGDTFQGEGFTFVAPDGWKELDQPVMKGGTSIYKVANDNEFINVVKLAAPQYEGLSAKDFKRSYKENFNVLETLGSTLEKIEVKSMPYGDVVYVELTTVVNQERIDSTLNSKLTTIEDGDELSDIDTSAENMCGSNVEIYYIKDKDVYMISAVSVGGKTSDIDDEALFVAENITFN